jgi:hypothetical protein
MIQHIVFMIITISCHIIMIDLSHDDNVFKMRFEPHLLSDSLKLLLFDSHLM